MLQLKNTCRGVKLVDAAGEKRLQRHQYLPTLMQALN
jgi:hypothetical protein